MLTLVAMIALHLSPANATVPYRGPQLASSNKIVALAFGAGNGIYVATSADQGSTFSHPVRVTEAAVVPLSRHRGPRIALTKTAIVVTAVTGDTLADGPHAHGLPSDGNLYAWRSIDGGASWSKGVRVNDAAGSAREGLHALASDGRGKLFAVWLDQRGEGTQLYGSFSRDNGATWSRNELIYKSPTGTICQCCHPSASFASNGSVDIMWRNCLDGARDFYLVSGKPGKTFSTAQKLGEGTWKINACPMDGGGITHTGSQTITAWRREGELYLAQPGKPEQKIGEGKDVAIAAAGNRVFAVWVAGDQLVEWSDGKTQALATAGTQPSMVALPDGNVLAAWEENGGISLRRFQ